jgi:hypothetical protein
MKTKILYAASALVALFATACTSDEPFSNEGEGSLRFRMVINSEVTRAETSTDSLAEKCVVYISDSKGLLYKYKGLENLPASINMKAGQYVAEAWTGDSVSASFDKKFYKGYEPFEITKGDVSSVVLNCKIANVVASVCPAENLEGKLKNYEVTVASTRGSLAFNEDNVALAHGYFMMPNGENSLTWTITGENEDGEAFTKQGVIPNVKSAHEYVLNLSYNPTVSGDVSGGAFINVTINDEELLVEDNITLYAAPTILGDGFDMASPCAGPSGSFSDMTFKIYAHDDFKSLKFSFSDKDAFGMPTDQVDLKNLTDDSTTAVNNAGMTWYFSEKSDLEQKNAFVTLSASMLNKLGNGEYSVTVDATDAAGRTRTAVLNITISDAAVEPVAVAQEDVRSYSVTLYPTLLKDEYTNPGVEYRKVGDTQWTRVNGVTTRASQSYKVALTNLAPGTKYEYRAVADNYVNPQVLTFTTDSIFTIPNSGFESWVTNSKGAYVPGTDTTPTFWDSGNHGSITMNVNITTPSTTMFHGGSTGACLKSSFVSFLGIGKLAAGNIFAGTYDKTTGTDGELTFGRPFDGSHPVKLRGWAHYRPGIVDNTTTDAALSTGDTDQAQIYVALATKSFEIKTKTKTLFNADDPAVLAYGELVLSSNFGPDNGLQQFEIEIKPGDAYFSTAPTYIVLVASASRYGDYFTGSSSSVLYIDDLELVYE